MAGRLVCTAHQSSGIRLFDVGSAMVPRFLAAADSPGLARQCLVLGTWAYVADDAYLSIFDVTVPMAPKLRLRVEGLSGTQSMSAAESLLYIVGSDGLRILDVRRPMEPEMVAELPMEAHTMDIALSGKHAYIAARERGLVVVDVSSPELPREISSLGTDLTSGQMSALALEGQRLVAQAGGALHLIDIGRPDRPRILHSLPRPYAPANMQIQGGIVLSAEGPAGLAVYRIGSPGATATFAPPATQAPAASATPRKTPTPRAPLPFRQYLPRVVKWR